MKRARVRSFRRGALLGVVAGVAFVVLAACGGDDPAASGGACSLASDCQPGLICVAQSGKGTCTDDLSKVAGQAAPDGAVAAAEAGAVDGAAAPDGGGTPVKDSSVADTGKPETGDAADTGAD